jgi:AcrR family transcriptional regulator
MDQTAARPAKHRRPPLSAERIAAEAMALVDDGGLDALSFRALGRRLGCEAMSIYHYFPSKQHLLDAMVTICLAETPIPPPGIPARERMHTLCLRYRQTVLRHAGFAPILLTHRLNHREGLAWLDQVAAMFGGDEVAPDRRATLFRVLSYFITGAALDEAMGYAKGPGAAEPMPAAEAEQAFPVISGLAAHFGAEHHLPFYEAGLGLILDWIDGQRAKG